MLIVAALDLSFEMRGYSATAFAKRVWDDLPLILTMGLILFVKCGETGW